MELLSNQQKKSANVIQEVEHLKIIDISGYTAIQEPDMVICIPYLKEKNSILLRYENIPTYNLVKPEMDKFINTMSTIIEKHETPTEALKRGLALEYGLKLKEGVDVEILSPIFLNKGNTAMYHICILPLMEHEYEQFVATGVQNLEMKNNNIILQISELNNIIIYDLITRYTIDLFKKHYSLF